MTTTPEFTQQESDVLEALETGLYHQELVGQYLNWRQPVLPPTPERAAVVTVLLHYHSINIQLLMMLPHLDIPVRNIPFYEIINYVSGVCYQGPDKIKPRILHPDMLHEYSILCQWIGKPIDVQKIWDEFCRRHAGKLKDMEEAEYRARKQRRVRKWVRQQASLQRLFNYFGIRDRRRG